MAELRRIESLGRGADFDLDIGDGIRIELDRRADGQWRFWGIVLLGERFGRNDILGPAASAWLEAQMPNARIASDDDEGTPTDG